jgi:hypothetical protein
MFNGDPGGRLDTTTLSNGSHTLTVDGYDAAGTRIATASKTVTVSNSAPAAPPTPPPTTPPPPPATTPPPPPPATTPPPPPPAPAPAGSCTTTISSGLASAIQTASAGSAICLNSGSYGNLSLTSVEKSADVTVQPAPGADVTIGKLTLRMVNHLRLTGAGGSLRIGGLDLDPADGDSTWSHHLTFDHVIWTAPTTVRTRGSHQSIVFDSSVFDNLGVGIYEGRISVRGYNNTQPVGVTISNSHFGGGGCSDGVQIVGNAYGVQIGPGNEFTGLRQSGCSAHVDPIQLYGSRNTLITGNWFHGNDTGVMAPDGGDHEQITNNVFVAGSYPYVLQIGSHRDGLIAHNTFVGGDIECGWHKTGATPSTNQTCRDNVFTGSLRPYDSSTLEDYNLCLSNDTDCKGAHDVKGVAVFVGGANPAAFTSRSDYRLAAGSPGTNAASDGSDIGITG